MHVKGLPMLRHSGLSRMLFATATAGALLASGAASAQDGGGWRNGSWYGDGAPRTAPPAPIVDDRGVPPYRQDQSDWEAQRVAQPGREAWLADCRSRVASRDKGVGGAVIGGVVGGVAGNRIAGRGNRVVGTVAGAAVGAVAGSAIDRAEDRGRNRDECEAYLDDYYTRYAAGEFNRGYPQYDQGYYQQPGYGVSYAPAYGYPAAGCCGQAPVMMVPVQQAQPQCTETVEYVYEDVPVHRRAYRPAVKRTKVVADKRIRVK
jgi:uncharacterized protein YcfJ